MAHPVSFLMYAGSVLEQRRPRDHLHGPFVAVEVSKPKIITCSVHEGSAEDTA